LGLASEQPMHFCEGKAELFPLGANVFIYYWSNVLLLLLYICCCDNGLTKPLFTNTRVTHADTD
jgi:hypothetical protein